MSTNIKAKTSKKKSASCLGRSRFRFSCFRFFGNRKGQHMTETVAVLFIFFILVAFGIIFYYKWHVGALKEERQQAQASRAMDTTLRVLFLPELQCSKGEAVSEDNCIDMLKMRALMSVDGGSTYFERHEDYYFNAFGYSKIVVHEFANSLPVSSDGADGSLELGDQAEPIDPQAPVDDNNDPPVDSSNVPSSAGSGEINYVLYDKKIERGEVGAGIQYEPTYFVVALRDIPQKEDGSTPQESYGFGYIEVGVYSEANS